MFNGLDTFTTIEVCGQIVGTTDNQFRQYKFEISQALENCKGDPTLELNFGSAPEIANAISHDPESERMHHPGTRELETSFFADAAQSGLMAHSKYTNSRTDGISAKSSLILDGTGDQRLLPPVHGETRI